MARSPEVVSCVRSCLYISAHLIHPFLFLFVVLVYARVRSLLQGRLVLVRMLGLAAIR